MLVEKIEDEFQIQCQSLSRNQWSAEKGLETIKRVCLKNDRKASLVLASSDQKHALAASSALLVFSATRRGVDFNDGSVKIEYKSLHGHMFIDPESVRNLELVQNNLNMKGSNTLLSTLNSCFTPMGVRLLRTSILQPSNQKYMIENRLDAVQVLVQSPDALNGLRKSLKQLDSLDLDKLIANLSIHQRKTNTPQQTEHRIKILLQLRKVLTALPNLCRLMQPCNAEIIKRSVALMSSPGVQAIGPLIEERINDESALGNRGNRKGQASKSERLYAIKSNCNQLLDLARDTHQENVSDIMEWDHGICTSMEWGETGYRFSCDINELDGKPLPKGYTNVEKGKRTIKFSSSDLHKLNRRMLQTQQEVFAMSDSIVEDLVQSVVAQINRPDRYVGQFRDRIEHHSNPAVVRPKFANTLVIKNGRHPILEATLPAGNCVSNDVYAAAGPAHFQLIQGPNMSGKSTYLRQIGLLNVQAMIGCFVPAEHAQFKLHDALLTRLSNDDCIEKSLSTFSSEMATSAMILGMATSKSLVIIDELGRGTAPVEGVGTSHAIAEELARRKCFTFFATHFRELGQTLCTHPGVVTHMGEDGEFSTTFHYKVTDGPSKEDHYGRSLDLAKLASLPPSAMARAWEVSNKLTELEEKGRNSKLANAVASRRKVIVELGGKLRSVLETSRRDDPTVATYLANLKADLVASLQDALETERASCTNGAPDEAAAGAVDGV
ncbi:MutS 4 [Vanrija pseudolonga]|uniref:DNA mismatch repair protein MSH3 n=1 Tax=Vanrija pseudolonga TaxID=143232 RepID=A0AAF0YC78_9TREE|nr:MutS 4 [Vanrija pseudolonga]